MIQRCLHVGHGTIEKGNCIVTQFIEGAQLAARGPEMPISSNLTSRKSSIQTLNGLANLCDFLLCRLNPCGQWAFVSLTGTPRRL